MKSNFIGFLTLIKSIITGLYNKEMVILLANHFRNKFLTK